MKTTKSLLATLAVILFAGIAFISCEGLEPTVVKPEDADELKSSAIQNSQADNAMGDVLGAISTYGISEDWTKNSKSGDPTVTIDSVTATITYPNGGVIVIVWNKEPGFIEGLEGSVTITNFVSDKVTISQGTLNVTFNGAIEQPVLTAEGTVNMTVDNNNIVYTINRTFIWYAGFDPNVHDFSDDAYAVHGTSKLVDGDETQETTILENQMLIKYNTCAYPQQGITKMEVVGQNRSVTVDFGVDKQGDANNQCDEYAKFTIKVGSASMSMIVKL
ncbi:MAG TPA: hypothetical protein PLS84_04795 [Salinivirgaceae bacterium]|nr:hypothetical protein [Salinivirgaceae bacterium]